MRQFPSDGVAHPAVAAAAMAPLIRCRRATQQDGPLRGEVLACQDQSEVVQAAERGQIRGGDGSVVHVEALGDGCVRTSIIPRTSTRIRTQGSATDPHPFILICEEPV
ncbi:hypothetical protein HMPREF3223_01701 [Cutibacterium avidum]|nr:hypothetical protein HMPREF3223_01701 [Cutibacterium avidum]